MRMEGLGAAMYVVHPPPLPAASIAYKMPAESPDAAGPK